MKKSFLAGMAIAFAYYILRQRVAIRPLPVGLPGTIHRPSPRLQKLIDDIMAGE